MFLPCILQISCKTWYRVVDMHWIFVVFFSWINGQEEHRLSSAQILASKYQSISNHWMKIECASDVVNVRKYSRSNQHVVLQCRINEIAPRMSLKSTEIKWLIPNNQNNTDIFVWVLRLQSNKPTIDRLTNFVLEDDGLVNGILFCRIELLHLLGVASDCVEEDWWLSSRDCTTRGFASMVQYQSILFHLMGWLSLQ